CLEIDAVHVGSSGKESVRPLKIGDQTIVLRSVAGWPVLANWKAARAGSPVSTRPRRVRGGFGLAAEDALALTSHEVATTAANTESAREMHRIRLNYVLGADTGSAPLHNPLLDLL